MQEGYLFYILTWLYCWYIVFISNKPKMKRKWQLIGVLTTICLSGFMLTFGACQVNAVWLFVIVVLILQWKDWSNQEMIMGCLTIYGLAIIYVYMEIFFMLYPVWRLIDLRIVYSFTLFLTASLLIPSEQKRLNVLAGGLMLGFLAFSILLRMKGMNDQRFSFESLDLLIITIGVAKVWSYLAEFLKHYLSIKHKNTTLIRGKSVR